MIKLCLMASHCYPSPGLVLHQELGISKVIKDGRSFLMSPGTRQEIIPAGSFNLKPDQLEPWKPVSSSNRSSQLVEIDSAVMRPMLIDVQDTPAETVLFSLGIAEQCARHEKALKFLVSRSDEIKDVGFDLSLLSNLMGLQALKSSAQQPYASSVLYMNQESGKPLFDLAGDMVHNSKIAVHPDGQVLFTGSRAELNDILSIVAEFYLSRNSARWRKLSPLVPQFTRLDSEVKAAMHLTPAKFEAVTVAPLKSPEKTKLKPSPKKKSTKKEARERDLYRRNYFHACESLLSLMIDKSRHKKATILSLKKSGGELSELLTQFSIGIAGTGIAVLFSVVCNVASGRVPFCADKFFNTGLGFSLVWLSWAVNKLSEAIVYVNRNATRSYSSVKDEEMMSRVERNIKEVYLRAATVMAVVALRFA